MELRGKNETMESKSILQACYVQHVFYDSRLDFWLILHLFIFTVFPNAAENDQDTLHHIQKRAV